MKYLLFILVIIFITTISCEIRPPTPPNHGYQQKKGNNVKKMTDQELFNKIYPSREILLPCIKSALDLNNDGNITFAEIEEGYATHISNYTKTHIMPLLKVEHIMANCDANKDGVLSMEDWVANTCVSSYNPGVRSVIGQICDAIKNGRQY